MSQFSFPKQVSRCTLSAPVDVSMTPRSIPSPSPLEAAVARILDSGNGQVTIEWESCESIWDSSNMINANAAENEV